MLMVTEINAILRSVNYWGGKSTADYNIRACYRISPRNAGSKSREGRLSLTPYATTSQGTTPLMINMTVRPPTAYPQPAGQSPYLSIASQI